MPLPKERIAYLLEVYTSKKATAQEEQELMEWMQDAQEDAGLRTYMEDLWAGHQPPTSAAHVDWDGMFHRIVRHDEVFSIAPPPKIKRFRWPRIAVAAAIFCLLATVAYWLLAPEKQVVTRAETEQPQPAGDVAPPVANKATLTLANGKVIVLDHAGSGSLAAQGVANASKLNDGQLAYTSTGGAVVEYHTLQVPKGSKPMQLQLADGSEVWLNAASAITFPNIFAGNERKVVVTGEVYLEVTHDANKPFFVSKGAMQVQVLGTKFNVNAYDDEQDIRITLLDGSVKVLNGNKVSRLKPGEQARLTNNRIDVRNEIDIHEVMAWKNGLFEFNETDIQTIMRQVERWYDVEVVFEGDVSQHFNGTIQRQVNASSVLNMLEKTGGIRFAIEGKKVVVKKY